MKPGDLVAATGHGSTLACKVVRARDHHTLVVPGMYLDTRPALVIDPCVNVTFTGPTDTFELVAAPDRVGPDGRPWCMILFDGQLFVVARHEMEVHSG